MIGESFMCDGILAVIGTRPEAIKMCPLILELGRRGERVSLCVTGQHRELADSVLGLFGVSADYDLDVMRPGQSLGGVTAAMLCGMERVLDEASPGLVLVHGDTATTLAAALACFYRRIPVGHVEAGLRTYDKTAPFPEEFNRRAVSLMADIHFAPTPRAARNLIAEGVDPERVFVTGNTVVDALEYTRRPDFDHEVLRASVGRRLIIVTLHRRESRGESMRRMFAELRRLADSRKDVALVCPLHPAPEVQTAAAPIRGAGNIFITPPLSLVDFHNLLGRSYFAVSDSGGVQEEALSLGVPVLVTRRCTERPEGIEAGGLRLVSPETLYDAAVALLDSPAAHDAMVCRVNPFGDGHACRRIADILEMQKNIFKLQKNY